MSSEPKQSIHFPLSYIISFDNFKPNEIRNAINEVCGTNITLDKVENIFKECENGEKKGINDIHPKVANNKIKINEKLLDNLIENYKANLDETIWDRKIFQIIDYFVDIFLVFNYLFPV